MAKKQLSTEQVDNSALQALHKIAASFAKIADSFKDIAMAQGQLVNIQRQQLGIAEQSLAVQKQLAAHSMVYEAMLHNVDDDTDGGERLQ